MLSFRNLLIYFTVLGMELSWLYATLTAANKSVADRLSVPLLVAILLISFAVSKGFRYLSWPKAAMTALSWLIWPVVMLLMVKVQLFPETPLSDPIWLASISQALSRMFSGFEPALLILLSSLGLWWLGRRLAYVKVEFSTLVTEFQFGLVMLMIVFFTAYELKLDQSSSLPTGMAFFALALLGISLSHASENSNWFNSSQKSHWPGILILSIIIILLLGLLVSIIVTPDLIQLILRAIGWTWDQILRFISFIVSLLPQPSPQEPMLPLPSQPGGEGPESGGFHLPEWLTSGGRIVWTWVFAALFIFAIYRIASQIFGWMRRRSARGKGEVESLRVAFWSDIINWIKRIISRLFGFKFSSLKKNKPYNIPPEIASVRQLYIQVLRWGSEGGHPRLKSQTPNEYQMIIDEALSENQADLDFITREYNTARYGIVSPTRDKLDQLKQKWHNLKSTVIKRP